MSVPERIAAFRNIMIKKGIDASIIVSRENVFYLSGFTGTSGDLFVTADNAYILTDSRYTLQARECSREFIVKEVSKGLSEVVDELIEKHNVKIVGFEDNVVSYATYCGMEKRMPSCTLVPLEDTIRSLRIIKDEKELEYLRYAASISDKAFEHIIGYIKAGVKEADIATELEYFMKKQGASGASFDTIVASGYRGSLPHGVAGDKLIENGDFIVIDFGCIYKGYCSDMTRTIAVGEISKRQREAYNITLFSQLKTLKKVKAGAYGCEIDAYARNVLNSFGYGGYFTHSLGHGIGINIHEAPTLSAKSKDVLQAGMVVTVEPGVYFDNEFGIRIEDSVVVNSENIEILTKTSKDLITI